MINPNLHSNNTPKIQNNKQKQSFISLQQPNTPNHNQFFPNTNIQYHGLGGSNNLGKSNNNMFQHSPCGTQRQRNNHSGKISNQRTSINAFIDDTESTKQFTRYDNYLSTQNLGNSFPNTIQIKNVRESQNIYTIPHNMNLPLKKSSEQIGSHKNIGITKSATNLVRNRTKQVQKQVILKSQIEEDCQQIKVLLEKIKFEQRVNQSIKEQNIQLRLMKLSSNSDSLQMLSLKLQIQDFKRKIQNIKNQKQKPQKIHTEYQFDIKQIKTYDISKDSFMIPINFCNHTKSPRGNQIQRKKYITSRRNTNVNFDHPNSLNPGYLENSKVPRSHSPTIFKNKIGKNTLKSGSNQICENKDEFEKVKESEKNTLNI